MAPDGGMAGAREGSDANAGKSSTPENGLTEGSAGRALYAGAVERIDSHAGEEGGAIRIEAAAARARRRRDALHAHAVDGGAAQAAHAAGGFQAPRGQLAFRVREAAHGPGLGHGVGRSTVEDAPVGRRRAGGNSYATRQRKRQENRTVLHGARHP